MAANLIVSVDSKREKDLANQIVHHVEQDFQEMNLPAPKITRIHFQESYNGVRGVRVFVGNLNIVTGYLYNPDDKQLLLHVEYLSGAVENHPLT